MLTRMNNPIPYQRSEFHSAGILCDKLCIAQQNRSIGVNVVYEGSPSLILRVLLISFGITIRPRSSTRRTIPVAFIYIYLLILQITLLVSTNKGDLFFDKGIHFCYNIFRNSCQARTRL